MIGDVLGSSPFATFMKALYKYCIKVIKEKSYLELLIEFISIIKSLFDVNVTIRITVDTTIKRTKYNIKIFLNKITKLGI